MRDNNDVTGVTTAPTRLLQMTKKVDKGMGTYDVTVGDPARLYFGKSDYGGYAWRQDFVCIRDQQKMKSDRPQFCHRLFLLPE